VPVRGKTHLYNIDFMELKQVNCESETMREIRLFAHNDADSLCKAVAATFSSEAPRWQSLQRIELPELARALPEQAQEIETAIGRSKVLGIFRVEDQVKDMHFKSFVDAEKLRSQLESAAGASALDFGGTSWLWHGTKLGTWTSCISKGMHPGYAHSSLSTNGCQFGKGYYAAKKLRTAMHYAQAGTQEGCSQMVQVALLLEANTGVPHKCTSYYGAVAPPLAIDTLTPWTRYGIHELASCVSDMAGDRHCFFESHRAIPRYAIFWASTQGLIY